MRCRRRRQACVGCVVQSQRSMRGLRPCSQHQSHGAQVPFCERYPAVPLDFIPLTCRDSDTLTRLASIVLLNINYIYAYNKILLIPLTCRNSDTLTRLSWKNRSSVCRSRC